MEGRIGVRTEFTISPLFCPQSLLNEGAANFGIDVAFPGDERLVFERDVLYPLAGLDRLISQVRDAGLPDVLAQRLAVRA